jgi:hypothetical protein
MVSSGRVADVGVRPPSSRALWLVLKLPDISTSESVVAGRHDASFVTISNRVALSHPVLTGISREHLAGLIEELADPWLACQESALRERRGGRDRLRAEGAGPNHRLPFVDRVIATLVIMRFQLPHAALAVLYGVDRSTVTRAVREIRPLPEQRGFAVPGRPGVRLRTLADVFAHAAAEGWSCASTALRSR